MLIPLHRSKIEPEAGNEFLGTGLASNYEDILIIDCTKGRKLSKLAWIVSQILRAEVPVRLTLEQVAAFNTLTNLEDSSAVYLAGGLEQHAVLSLSANESYFGAVAKNFILPRPIMR